MSEVEVLVGQVVPAIGAAVSAYGVGVLTRVQGARAPELLERVSFDSEAGMFVAYGTDAKALRRLGSQLSEASRDRSALAALIEAGEPERSD